MDAALPYIGIPYIYVINQAPFVTLHGQILGCRAVFRMFLGGVALRKTLGWAPTYQYIQTIRACHMPFGKRPKEGKQNQPKTNRQRQPAEDTPIGTIGGNYSGLAIRLTKCFA